MGAMPTVKESSENAVYHFVFRGLLGLLIGVLAGAILGACLLILLVGPGEYFKNLGEQTPAGIISASSTNSRFTLAITFAFGFYGAIGGGLLGLLAGLVSASRATAPKAARADDSKAPDSPA